MKIIKRLSDYRSLGFNSAERLIGFVPTMGALHEGHLSLVRRAREECPTVVVSIFVNPKQFGPHEDFARYPRSFEQDMAMLHAAGVDVLVAPEIEEFYPEGYATYVSEELLSTQLCGASRPGHFRGVTTVVAKLFNMVQPARAYFGQKDLQQFRIIERMVTDLNFPVQLVLCDTVREADGLAMSSRNRYLAPAERQVAAELYRTLIYIKDRRTPGLADPAALAAAGKERLRRWPQFRLDYLEIRRFRDLGPATAATAGPDPAQEPLVALIAAHLGKTRLIDNLVL